MSNSADDMHQRLHQYALESKSTVSDVVLTAIKRELAMREWRKRLAQRPKTDLGFEAADLLREERSLRDAELVGPDVFSN